MVQGELQIVFNAQTKEQILEHEQILKDNYPDYLVVLDRSRILPNTRMDMPGNFYAFFKLYPKTEGRFDYNER